jgi:hypothetical protein
MIYINLFIDFSFGGFFHSTFTMFLSFLKVQGYYELTPLHRPRMCKPYREKPQNEACSLDAGDRTHIRLLAYLANEPTGLRTSPHFSLGFRSISNTIFFPLGFLKSY